MNKKQIETYRTLQVLKKRKVPQEKPVPSVKSVVDWQQGQDAEFLLQQKEKSKGGIDDGG